MKTVLITGAARGIGAAIAELYHVKGYRVLRPTRSELDLGSEPSIRNFISSLEGEVDVLINNAGENVIKELAQVEPADMHRSLMINLVGPTLLMNLVVPGMRTRHWGRVVNVSSIFGHVSRAGRGPYTMAKTGLLGATRTAAIEWGMSGVLVNAICPGYIETDLTRQNNTPEQIAAIGRQLPLGRLGQPSEVAKAVYFLGSEENTFITGQSLVIDGGFLAQ